MGAADLFCGPYLDAQRVNRYRKAYPEDQRTAEEILEYLDYLQDEKKIVNRIIKKLINRK